MQAGRGSLSEATLPRVPLARTEKPPQRLINVRLKVTSKLPARLARVDTAGPLLGTSLTRSRLRKCCPATITGVWLVSLSEGRGRVAAGAATAASAAVREAATIATRRRISRW